jgi:hypothetical protein
MTTFQGPWSASSSGRWTRQVDRYYISEKTYCLQQRKMDVADFSEISIPIYEITWYHVREERNLQLCHSENLKSDINFTFATD